MAEKKRVSAKKIASPKERKPKALKRKTVARDGEKKAAESKPAAHASAEVLQSETVIWHPLVSEKAVGMIDSQNKLHFIVKPNATKLEVRKAVEALYGVRVKRVRTVLDMKGRKKAIVQLRKEFKATELAGKIGVL